MFLDTSNKARRLLCLRLVQHVRPEELKRSLKDVKVMLADLPRGFRLLVDLSRLESMHSACTPEVARMMELFDKKGLSMVVRVISDSHKDNQLKALALFHYQGLFYYRHKPRVKMCRSMAVAAKLLSL